jgi:hypothetical protein
MDTILRQVGLAILTSLALTVLVWVIPPLRKWFDITLFRSIGHPPFKAEMVVIIAGANPGQIWKEKVVEIKGNLESIPYPYWDCWALYHQPEIVSNLGFQFMEANENLLESGIKVCAISNPALFFLGSIDDWIRSKGALIFPLEQSYPLARDWIRSSRLILFDINLNTGKTMSAALHYFRDLGWDPLRKMVVLFNDLVPDNEEFLNASGVMEQLTYLIKGSEITQHWKSQTVAEAVRIVQAGLRDTQSWDDEPIQGALRLLRTHPPVGTPSGYFTIADGMTI